jgi:two-component system, OmpR family, sensor histidine kinase ArlS
MTLKRRIAIGVSIIFSVLFGLAVTSVYISFSTFRKEEFFQRLEEKALTTTKLLVEVNEVDLRMLRLIDANTVNKLYSERTLVFDSSYRLIYSSIDDANIRWRLDDLERLKNERLFYRTEDGKDMLGMYYEGGENDYYVLVAAEDKYGYSRLAYLRISLIITFLLGTVLVWMVTNYAIRRFLKPLDEFQEQITTITVNKLSVHMEESGDSEEINLLASAFNKMLLRIDSSFAAMREFTSNASHELRTPLTRIAFQLENLMKSGDHPEQTMSVLKAVTGNVYELSNLVNSLLLLSKMDRGELKSRFSRERMDEIIFAAHQQVNQMDNQFQINFSISDHEDSDATMEVFGSRPLLEAAMVNLLKNACLYSPDKRASVHMEQTGPHELCVTVSNLGKPLAPEEQERLFEPFTRGSNAVNTQGSGLGLRITRRILEYHNARISYAPGEGDEHRFVLVFRV